MTGFILPELLIESIIRDGLANIRQNPAIIDSVFAQLTRSYNSRKYGTSELAKIKAMIAKDLAIVHSYHEVESRVPCFSIAIGRDQEDERRAQMGDYYESISEQIVDPVALAALIKVSDVVPLTYNTSGKVTVDDSVNLALAYSGMIFVDASDSEFVLTGGIDNTPGQKCFFIQKDLGAGDINLGAPGNIKSSLDYQEYEIRGVTSNVTLVMGCNAKDALTTKYLYILLKYFILSRKSDIISRGLVNLSFDGSDFNKDQEYMGDKVYSRFLTITGKLDDTWRSDQVVLIDNIDINGTPIE